MIAGVCHHAKPLIVVTRKGGNLPSGKGLDERACRFGTLSVLELRLGPDPQGFERHSCILAERGKGVFHAERNLREHFALNDSVIFEFAQRAREHLRRNSVEVSLKLAKAHPSA